ncbi:hypothetical protein RSAG8_03729, partial [Rhizoctonia solani AG-8 WAC10335]
MIQGNSTAYTREVNREAADHWSKLSAGYSESGDHKAALNARQKAVEICRCLYEAQPELGESPLAGELLELSRKLVRVLPLARYPYFVHQV